jgi:hypothetical protein
MILEKRSIAVGLTASMFVAAVTLGLNVIAWHLEWPASQGPALIAHVCAMLSLSWMLLAHLTRYATTDDASERLDLADVLHVGAMTTGLIAVISMLYAAVCEAIFRTLLAHWERTLQANIWPSGFIDLGLIALVLALAWQHSRNREILTAFFWLLVLSGIWYAFQTPAFKLIEWEGMTAVVTTDWLAILMACLSVVAIGFAWGTSLADRRRRWRAWPDALDQLAEPPTNWPGLSYSVGIVAVTVLILACLNLAHSLTGPAAILTGIAVLSFAHRRWNENLADAGLALITLGVISLINLCFPALPRWWTPQAWANVLNRSLIGLAIMVGIWYWLSGVWDQQLDHGRPWTTTGRLIRPAQRVGYLVAATAVLVAMNLAFWPKLAYVPIADNSGARWFWGITAYLLLARTLFGGAMRTRRPTVGWLVLLTGFCAVVFMLVRAPHSLLAAVWAYYWPLCLSAAAWITLPVLLWVRRKPWGKPLIEPLHLSAVLILPMTAMAVALLGYDILLSQWIAPITFLSLAGLYGVFALYLGPKTFASVAMLCVVLAAWRWQNMAASAIISPGYANASMLCFAMAALAWAIHQRRSSRIGQVIMFAALFASVGLIVIGLTR